MSWTDDRFSLRLLDAVELLATETRAPTVRDLESYFTQAGEPIGPDLVANTVKNLRRSQRVRIVRTRRVDYRNRPVAEYAPAVEPAAPESDGLAELGSVISGAWR